MNCRNPGCESGWVLVGSDDAAVKPCQECSPDVYERWAGGHYRLNHFCDECSELRRGKGKVVERERF